MHYTIEVQDDIAAPGEAWLHNFIDQEILEDWNEYSLFLPGKYNHEVNWREFAIPYFQKVGIEPVITKSNVIKSLTFESEAAYTMFILRWS